MLQLYCWLSTLSMWDSKLSKPVFKILLHTLFWKVSETEGILNLIYLSMAPTLPNVMLLYMKLWTCSGITREGMKAGTSLEIVLLKSSNTMMDIQRFFTGFLTRKTICHSWTNMYVMDSYETGKVYFEI